MGWWEIEGAMGGIARKAKMAASEREHESAPDGPIERATRVRRGEVLVNGDGPANTLGVAMDSVVAMWRTEWQRPPTARELTAACNFVIAGLVASGDIHADEA